MFSVPSMRIAAVSQLKPANGIPQTPFGLCVQTASALV